MVEAGLVASRSVPVGNLIPLVREAEPRISITHSGLHCGSVFTRQVALRQFVVLRRVAAET
jgi:hypothetical protein